MYSGNWEDARRKSGEEEKQPHFPSSEMSPRVARSTSEAEDRRRAYEEPL